MIPTTRVLAILTLSAAYALGQSTPPPANSEPPAPPLQTTVTVNATLATETPASISVLDQQAVQSLPGVNLDDRLRQLPGFSLFRRSSSLVANPTTQGVSLRAIGSTGASRTLVLDDGIPLNDPFGGWVYWTRVDPDSIDRVEVNRGASTSLFGDKAMGGTISLFSAPERREHLFAEYFGGNNNTHDVSVGYTDLWGRWGLSLYSRDFTTNGYYITPQYARGTADTRANVQFATGDVHLDYLGTSDRLSIRLNMLAEGRNNGTNLTHNSSGIGTLGLTYTHSWSKDQVSFLAYHTQEQYHSTYSSVSLNRNTETLSSRQTVPADDTGGALYWQHHEKHWNSTVGADVDDTHGISSDYSYSTRILTRSGGTLLEHGLFGQGDYTIGPARFFAGIRHQFTGQQGQTFVSPSGGVAVGLKQFRLRTAAYRSFRAPTLNELYRNFRVGNVLTFANANLKPEGLTGVEAGVDWSYETTRVSFTLFHNSLDNLVDNTTLTTTPTLITRQRQNFPTALSQGAEVSAVHRWTHWRAEAGYMFADARLSTGQRIPQIPKQQGTAQLMYSTNSTLVSVGIRAFGLQFDDDLNQFKLPGYAALQFTAQQHLTKSISAVASIENLLDRSYLVALTPNPNIGAPRLWRIGLRWSGAVH